jgi:hypothetical protein
MNSSRAIFVSGAIALMSGASPVAIAQSQNASGIANNDSIFIDGRSLTISRGKSKGDSAAEIKRLGAKEMGPATLIIRSGDKLFVADLQPPGATTTSYNPSAVHALDPHRVTTGYNPSAVHAVDPHRVTTGYNPSAVHAVDPHRVTGYNPSAVHAVDPHRVTGYNPSAVHAVDPHRGYNPSAVHAVDPHRGYNPSAVHAVDPHRGYNPSAVHAVDPHRVTGYNPSAVHAVDPHRGYNPSAVHAVDPSGVRILVNDPEYVHYKLKKAFEDNWTITGDPKQ